MPETFFFLLKMKKLFTLPTISGKDSISKNLVKISMSPIVLNDLQIGTTNGHPPI